MKMLCHLRTTKVQISLRISLSSAFVVRCLDSIISLDSIAEFSRTYLASVAAQAGLCLAGSETPKDTFCHVVADIKVINQPFHIK